MIKNKIVKVTKEKSGKYYLGIPISYNNYVPVSEHFEISALNNGCLVLTPVRMG